MTVQLRSHYGDEEYGRATHVARCVRCGWTVLEGESMTEKDLLLEACERLAAAQLAAAHARRAVKLARLGVALSALAALISAVAVLLLVIK
jgi:hypothetical protein